MTLIRIAVCAALIAFAFPRSARACGQGGGGNAYAAYALGLLAIGVPLATADLAFTVSDIVYLAQGEHPSVDLSMGEVLVGGAQAALGVALYRSTNSGVALGYTLWMSALTLHGIWGVATSGEEPSHAPRLHGEARPVPLEMFATPRRAERLQLAFGPTAVSLGGRTWAGLGVRGRF